MRIYLDTPVRVNILLVVGDSRIMQPCRRLLPPPGVGLDQAYEIWGPRGHPQRTRDNLLPRSLAIADNKHDSVLYIHITHIPPLWF